MSLQYAQATWSPSSQKFIDMLENVQKRATKMVDEFSALDYEERLRKLELPILMHRRARGDMIEVYKHVHTYDDTLIPDVFKLQPYGIRKHDFKLVWRKAKYGVREV